MLTKIEVIQWMSTQIITIIESSVTQTVWMLFLPFRNSKKIKRKKSTDFIPYDTFSEIQKQIIDMKLRESHFSWKEWMKNVKETLNIHFSPLSILVSLKSLLLVTNGSQMGVVVQILSFVQQISKNSKNYHFITSILRTLLNTQFVELVVQLKTSKLCLGDQFLRTINCKKLQWLLLMTLILNPADNGLILWLTSLTLILILHKQLNIKDGVLFIA